MQVVNPFDNAFLYKDILLLINNVSLRNEQIFNYLKTLNYTIPDNEMKTIVVNNSELYHFSQIDNIINFLSIDGKYIKDTNFLLQTLVEIIVIIIKTKYKTPFIANLASVKLCCFLPPDKKVPFDFIKYADNQTTNLYGQPLPLNMTLYIRIFEFDNDFNLKLLPTQISVPTSIPTSTSVPIPTSTSIPTSVPLSVPLSTSITQPLFPKIYNYR